MYVIILWRIYKYGCRWGLVGIMALSALVLGSQVKAEECIVAGFTGSPSNPQWLSPEAALELLQTAVPTANANDGIKQREVRDLLDRFAELSPDLEVLAQERAEELGDTYARIRSITKGKRSAIHPQMPMDLLGLLILTPG